MLNVAVAGCGSWGPNLVRNFSLLRRVNLHSVCDTDRSRLSLLKKQYDHISVTEDYLEILNNPEVDAIVIATPASTHYRLAMDSLKHDKHVLVEKPLALSTKECVQLVECAESRNKVLMVGHTFLFNSAVNKLKEYIVNKEIGEVFYIFAERLNLGQIRRDVNALWNFAPHDISIMLHILERVPYRVRARGLKYTNDVNEDIVFIDLDFSDGIASHIYLSWLNPLKVRRMTVVGSKKMIIYDDANTDAKIQLYDKGLDKIPLDGGVESYGDFQLKLRAGDIFIPKINYEEPLKVQCNHFIDCIENGKRPLTDGRHGLKVVKIIAAAEKSIKNNSKHIELKWN